MTASTVCVYELPAVAKGPESTQHILSHSIVNELDSNGST